ncbi:MAG TPA: phosphoribosylformylglycinamidine cyclo-ligase [Phycisphaerae bacterium]|nr:phosphoribosylformylglycinamidine cyclo-ligase [Phycisphaerae bacterium]
MSKGLTYKAAGVDMAAGDHLVDAIQSAIKRTHGPRVVDLYGHFAGLFRLDYNERLFKHNYRHPVLVAGTDGVGTKLRIAIDAKRVGTIGQDLVAMCINDVVVLGAEPLFFLDYLATAQLDARVAAEAVIGIAEACQACDCALLGGETAEMPGFYAAGDFDLAGFAVGIVEKNRVIDGSRIEEGDTVLGLASSGVHSNGYSLVRKILEKAGLGVHDPVPGLGGTVAEVFLEPTRLYSPAVLKVLRHYGTKRVVHGMAHITGGGIPGNVPRILPKGLEARIEKKSWPVPPVFTWLQKAGDVPPDEMGRVFNMGIGFVLMVSPYYADHVAGILERAGETVYHLGRVARGGGEVVLV